MSTTSYHSLSHYIYIKKKIVTHQTLWSNSWKRKEKKNMSSRRPHYSKALRTLAFLLLLLLVALVSSHEEKRVEGLVESEMESLESERRSLKGGKVISIGAMRRDLAVCNKVPGKTYKISCLPNPSNSYHRGCSNIYYCRNHFWYFIMWEKNILITQNKI